MHSSMLMLFHCPFTLSHVLVINRIPKCFLHLGSDCLYLVFLTYLCHICVASLPLWFTLIKIILANDVERNSGFGKDGLFTFCNWNLNSLAKDNFYLIDLLEAHNNRHHYDIISVCVTGLSDSVELPSKMLDGYSFIACHNPNNN